MSERSIFLAALDIADPAQRATYLDQVCGNDAALRKHIEELIAAEAKVGGFLARPHADVERTDDYAPATDRPGTQIGRYKLLQQIGEGGMGIVYMAEQKVPVSRRVALKIIKPGMDTRQVIARFEAERQALSMMDHPNIARVLEAGTTDSGRPYFVMELVKGQPITQYCDEHHLTPRERLELFLPVCQAIQHAHQKGIIHRDVKPSNILVAEYDHQVVPKVIDFGVAKATSQSLTEKTMFTGLGQIVGTLEYMSPEQAKVNQLDIDTRSDIYSLGVLLYELLTGTTPFDKQRLRSAAFDEMLRIIREEEPPRPSTRLSTINTLVSVATNRKTEPGRLSGIVRGELDWIVMKALDKDRNRRYETANGLAMDIQRYLQDEPVQACPPSAAYRLRKFARRNKGPALAATVVLLTLIGGIVGTTWGLIRAEQSRRAESQHRILAEAARERETARAEAEVRERGRAEAAEATAIANENRANTERDRAEQETRVAQAVKDFLQNRLLNQADPRNQANALLEAGDTSAETGFNPTIRELLDRAAAELTPEKIETQFPNLPLVQAEILRTIGNAYAGCGKNIPAIAHLERSRDLYVAQLGPDHPETLTTLFNLAVAHGDTALLKQVVDQRRAKFGPDHPETLGALYALAHHYRGRTEKNREAVALYEQVRDQRIAKLGADHADTLDTMQTLAWAYRSAGREADAIRLFEQVRDLQIKKLGPHHPDTLLTQSRLAQTLGQAGRYAESIQLFEQLHEPLNAIVGPDRYQTLLSRRWHATTLEWAKKYPEAIKLYEEVRDRYSATNGPDHPATLDTQSRLANTYRLVGRVPEAIQLLERVRDQQIAQHPDHWETLDTQRRLAAAYRAADRLPEAIELLEQLRDRRDKTFEGLEDMTGLASAYQAAGRLPEAIQVLEYARDQRIARRGPDHVATLEAIRNLARMHWTAGNLPVACQLVEHVRDRYVATLGPDDSHTLSAQRELAFMYRDTGRLPEAIALFEQERDRSLAKNGPDHSTTREFTLNLSFALERAGQFDKLIELQRELLKVERERSGTESSGLAFALSRLGFALLKTGQFAEADSALKEGLQNMEQRLPDSALTNNTKVMLGWALVGQQKYAEAEPILLAGYEGLTQRQVRASSRSIPSSALRLTEALENLVELYTATNKPDEAAKWQKTLDDHLASQKSAEPPPAKANATESAAAVSVPAIP